MIVGLGNPGPRYQRTRHNAGWLVLDALAERLGTGSWKHKFKGSYCEGRLPEASAGAFGARDEGLLLVKPETFMNDSGECVVAFAGYYHLPLEQVLVVVDDVNLALGTLRMRRSGSDGGHNGLKDIARRLGSQAYPRLRFGVGAAAEGRPLIGHVLSEFGDEEYKVVSERIPRAADAALAWAGRGCEEAMNAFNG